MSDLDNDGDMDFIAGNLVMNNQMKLSLERLVILCYADYDGNGSVDPILYYCFKGRVFLLRAEMS